MLETKLKPNIQLFAEGDPEPPATPPVSEPAPAAPTAQGKVFSEDYVGSLRRESASHRTQAKTYEAALRKVLGVADGEELGNLDERISNAAAAQQTAIENAMAAANDRLITAEIRSLEGYDHKLLEKVIDRTKIKVKDDGTIEGLEDAVKNAETEFPAVKNNTPPFYAAGTGTAGMSGNYSPEDAALRSAFGLDTQNKQ